MSDDLRRRKRPKRKKAGLSPVLIVAMVAVPVLLLGGCGVVGVVVSLASGGVIGGRVGAAFALPNPRVTRAGFEAVPMGASLAQVEATLGAGRPPATADFDAVFGKPGVWGDAALLIARPVYEENHRRGLVLVWANGRSRILITLNNTPEGGGRVVAKLFLSPDGSLTTFSGGF